MSSHAGWPNRWGHRTHMCAGAHHLASGIIMRPCLRPTDGNLDTLTTVPYVDHPELKFNEHESTQMPFRYVTDKDGKPIMPEVRGVISFGHLLIFAGPAKENGACIG